MGQCVSKLKQSQKKQTEPTQKKSTQPIIQPIKSSKTLKNQSEKTVGSIQTTQKTQMLEINTEFPNNRQIKYWERRINRICNWKNYDKHNEQYKYGNQENGKGETNGWVKDKYGKGKIGYGDTLDVQNGKYQSEKGQKKTEDGTNYEVGVEHFCRFFKQCELSEKTLIKLYHIFKGNKQSLTKQQFLQQLKKFSSLNNQQLAFHIHSLYFSQATATQSEQLSTFSQDFKHYLKSSLTSDDSLQLKVSNSQRNIQSQKTYEQILKQLNTILKKRKTLAIEDNKSLMKWLGKNILFRKFRAEVLEGGARLDEMEAYRAFLWDYGVGGSRIKEENREVVIVNWKWCQKMVNYFQSKYEVQGMPKLKKKSTQIQSPLPNFKSIRTRKKSSQYAPQTPLLKPRTSSTNMYNSTIAGIHSPISQQLSLYKKLTSQSIQFPQIKSIEYIKIKDKQVGSGYQFKNYPNEIDNNVLMGDFQWELKRNIRRNVDYVILGEDSYWKLWEVFGGGPVFYRRVIHGYMEIRPYFVYMAEFSYDDKRDFTKLKNTQILKLSPISLLASLIPKPLQNYIYYHRNIGNEWSPLQLSSNQKKSKKLSQIFSQTSFLLYMQKSQQKYFKRQYLSKFRLPKIGDHYISKTYKILQQNTQQNAQTNRDRDFIKVCVTNDQQKTSVQFVVLNWLHYLSRKISINQFQRNFTLEEQAGQLMTMSMKSKKRAGISNLGNTCYMNAVLQAFLVAMDQSDVKKFKGDLGVELVRLWEMITQKKRTIFPIDFKTCFDKYFPFFMQKSQQDSHQFSICLFQQLEKEQCLQPPQNQPIQSLLSHPFTLTTKCLSCQQVKQQKSHQTILTLFIKDFMKKQVKIDYIVNNMEIQTVSFSVGEECKVSDWKKEFEKVRGAKEYYICQIYKSMIVRGFNKEDGLDEKQFEELNLTNEMLITAYETPIFKYQLKQNPALDYSEFKTYKNSSNTYQIVKTLPPHKQSPPSSSSTSPSYTQNLETEEQQQQPQSQLQSLKKIPVLTKTNSQAQQRTINQNQLYKFPQQYPSTQVYIKLFNYDNVYNECNGKPFVFKMLNHYPLAAVRMALETCIGKNGYFLKICKGGDFNKCQICGRYGQLSSECFYRKENRVPLGWVDGLFDIVVIWPDFKEYYKLIQRKKFTPMLTTQNQRQYDKFSTSYSQKTIESIPQYLCQYCKNPLQIQRIQKITKWPQILIVHLSRFKCTNQENKLTVSKIHTKWLLQLQLEIERQVYKLVSVICHIGNNVDSGHFVTYTEAVKYDDQVVENSGFGAVKGEQVYMMFYRKIGRK